MMLTIRGVSETAAAAVDKTLRRLWTKRYGERANGGSKELFHCVVGVVLLDEKKEKK
jgi:hypothetical protein